jgi:hypothetical protein
MVSEGRAVGASKALRAAALGVGSVVFGLGWAGSATASAAEPTQHELIEQIKALQTKVDKLEARQQRRDDTAQPSGTQPAASQKDATVDSVLRDAERRSGAPAMLQAEGFTAGYSKGKFLIQDAAGNYVLHPQLQFMPRWAGNFRDNAKHSGTESAFDSGFEIRRMKLGFDGNVFGPNLTYLFLWASDRNSGNLILEEAWAKYAFTQGSFKDFAVRAGQFKDPFAHESLTSSKRLLAAERTLLNDLFTGGDNFVQGVSLIWDDGPDGLPLRAEVAYTDGANAPNQNYQDFPVNKANFGGAGRIEYLAMGKWSEYEDFTALGNDEDLLVFGAGVDITEAGNNDTLLMTADVQYETGRLGLYGAYLGRSVEDLRVGTGAAARDVNTYDYGFIAQAAYLVNDHLEPFVRYDYINFDKAGLPSGFAQNKVHEFTAGANYYFKGHAAKLTADVTYLPNGTPFANSGGDILASNDEAEFVVRAQFQLLL